MRSLSFGIDTIDRLAGRHEESIPFGPAEANVRANFGQANLTDAGTIFSREDMHAIIPITDPTSAITVKRRACERFQSNTFAFPTVCIRGPWSEYS